MATARGSHAAATLADGRVLVIGGLVPDNGGPATIDDATTEIYDPASGTFSPGPDLTVARYNHSAVTLNDGRVLVIGGQHLRSAESTIRGPTRSPRSKTWPRCTGWDIRW
jgi:hypothetical protein